MLPELQPNIVMVTLAGEEALIDDLHLALSLAVQDHEKLDDNALDYLGNTKLNKLYYYAIEEFNLPITYSWYLAGAHLAAENATVDTLEKTYFSIDRTINQRPEFVDNRVQTDTTRSISEYQDFFRKKIDDIWFSSLNDFLEDFYKKHAPSRYRSLYIKSLNIRRLFQRLTNEVIDMLDNTQQVSLRNFGEFDSEARTPDVLQAFHNTIEQLELELANDQELSQTVDEFSKFRDAARYIVEAVSDVQRSELTKDYIKVIKRTDSFYFNHAWQYPCLIISKNTATGPQKKKVILDNKERLQNFPTNYRSELEEYIEDCSQAGFEIGNHTNLHQ